VVAEPLSSAVAVSGHGHTERDVFELWARRGSGARLVDLYEMIAAARGLPVEDLSRDERERITERALPMTSPGFETVPGSGRGDREPVEIVIYDALWPARFMDWRHKLAESLNPIAPRIEHVGSTSVPGLAAKPVIDIQISVDDVADEAAYVPGIESVGIQLRSREHEHRFFRPFAGRPRDVHVHVCATGSRWERRHLLFRDYLRADADARAAYTAAKAEIAVRWRDDRIAYADAKTDIIEELMARAEVWAAGDVGQGTSG
jgi:GrpB-like predicted nucleotidyltransferase (UPF0157 family)